MTNTEPLDPHAYARALNWVRHNGTSELALFIDSLAREIRRLRDREWMNMPDDTPDTYLGYKQPGAAPKHYMPDDVVVDGDWLVEEIAIANRWRAEQALRGYEEETR